MMEIEKQYSENLPPTYLDFLRKNPNGKEMSFNEYPEEDPEAEGRDWNLMGEAELLRSWEMNGVGSARNFECLKLYVQLHREFGEDDYTSSNAGNIKLERVEAGFVIGEEYGDYLYLDPADNFSLWIYYHDGGDLLKVADSFKAFLKKEN